MSGQPFRARFGFDADGQKLIDLADPTAGTDGVNLQTLKREAGVHMAARIGNLPSPNDPDPTKRPVDGRAYLVKYTLDGQPMDRIAVWDGSQPATGGVGAVDVIEPAADAAAITAAAGTSDAGKPFTAGRGVGAVLDLTANADGTITGTVTTAGTNYAIGDSMVVPAASLSWTGMTGDTTVVVTALAGASPTGGWRFVDPQVWVHALVTDPNPAFDGRPGDLIATTELGKESLQVWTGTAWHTLFDVPTIKGWIASLNLFQGTTQEVGGTVVGALPMDQLPDITDPAVGAQHTSQYWVWVGQAGYVVKAGDPNGVGADLANAVLQVGDWLQVASSTPPGGGATTYRWSHIGGDLLAKSRADALYGLQNWVAGNYEKDTLVVSNGQIYRATRAVTTADTAPGTVASAGPPPVAAAPWTLVPLAGGLHSVATDADLPATGAPAGQVYLVLQSAQAGAKPGLFTYDAASTAWVLIGGGGGVPMTLGGGDLMVNVGCPVGTIVMWASTTMPPGWLELNGQAIDAAAYPELAALFPGGNLPDLRGGFPRMWGPSHPLNLTMQPWTTGRPRNAFTTNTTGSHTHSLEPFNRHGLSNGGGNGNIEENSGGGHIHTQPAGNHSHTITGGGDAETAPTHFVLGFIIKAIDNGVRLRTTP